MNLLTSRLDDFQEVFLQVLDLWDRCILQVFWYFLLALIHGFSNDEQGGLLGLLLSLEVVHVSNKNFLDEFEVLIKLAATRVKVPSTTLWNEFFFVRSTDNVHIVVLIFLPRGVGPLRHLIFVALAG